MVWLILVVSHLPSVGTKLLRVLRECLGEARRLAAAKGLYLNNNIVDPKQVLRREDLIDERVVVLRAGKNKHLVLDCQP